MVRTYLSLERSVCSVTGYYDAQSKAHDMKNRIRQYGDVSGQYYVSSIDGIVNHVTVRPSIDDYFYSMASSQPESVFQTNGPYRAYKSGGDVLFGVVLSRDDQGQWSRLESLMEVM